VKDKKVDIIVAGRKRKYIFASPFRNVTNKERGKQQKVA
jgi:hypothetical protein